MIPGTIRRASTLAIALLLVVSGTTLGADSRVVQAVTWNVDHAQKTITATVRLRLGSACTRGQMARATTQGAAAAARCKVTPEIAKAIEDNIERIWNNGYRYFCYKLKVDADIDISDQLAGAVAGSEAAPPDRAFVAIDQSAAGVRSQVSSHGYPDATWDGYRPRDAVLPANGGDDPSVWEYPPLARDVGLYAHEAGHVMGLTDGYEDHTDAAGRTVSRTRAGAPEDLMADQAHEAIDQRTVNRLVARADVSAYDLKCDWTVDREVPGGTWKGTKCGGIEGEWVITTDIRQGPTSVEQTWRFQADAEGLGAFSYKDHTLTKVPQSTAESWARASGDGTATMKWDGTVTMQLVETEHRSKGKGTAAGRTFTVPEYDSPIVTWDFTWQPTVCAPAG